MTGGVMTVELTMSGKGRAIRPRGSALSADQITQELYGLKRPIAQGSKAPMICSMDISLIVDQSNHLPTIGEKEVKIQPNHGSVFMDPYLVELEIDNYRKRKNERGK